MSGNIGNSVGLTSKLILPDNISMAQKVAEITPKVNPSEDIQKSSSQPSAMPPPKNLKPIFLIIALLVAIGLLGTYSVLSSKQIQPSSPPVLNVPSSKPPVKSDPTADWKTYTNKGFAYSIQYPKDWVVAGGVENSPLIALTNSVNQTRTTQDISVSIMVIDTNETFLKYLDSFLPEASWKKTSEDITINGMKGVKWIVEDPYAVNNQDLAKVVFFPRQSKNALFVYSIRIYGPKAASDLSNLILSTFKFLDQGESAHTSAPTPDISSVT